ncbi:hypothetical protein LTR53_004770 [Teratosphaeriaceae sp. CCFEE 6253]|nr:hypothetical protein LTR53_004770 [Teratosphaeriaceae sp. CCFEE 6253]
MGAAEVANAGVLDEQEIIGDFYAGSVLHHGPLELADNRGGTPPWLTAANWQDAQSGRYGPVIATRQAMHSHLMKSFQATEGLDDAALLVEQQRFEALHAQFEQAGIAHHKRFGILARAMPRCKPTQMRIMKLSAKKR